MISMPTEIVCAECGGVQVHERVAPITHKIGRREVTVVADRHLSCPDCGNISYRGSMLSENQRAIAENIRREDGLLSPDELRAIRVKYGFTQAEMERLLKTGEKTWVRWERGKVTQSQTADQLIRQIATNPQVLRDLAESGGVNNETAVRVLASMDEQKDIIARHQISLPVDVDAIAGDLGIRVCYYASLGRDVAGKIVRQPREDGASRYEIHVNSREPRNRQRFTISHELAHFVLHGDVVGDGIVHDVMYRSGLADWRERQANRMAAEILLPASLVRRHFREKSRALASFIQAFDVSGDVARIRLQELGLGA
jgi:putative zinc finger/helix-turn-helix YgiT family protein